MGLLLEFQTSYVLSSGSSPELLDSSLWSELPDDLVLNLLAHLPLQCVAQFRTVCKKWSNILSSTHFMDLWSKASNRPHPWLFMCNPRTEHPSLVYSFATNSWETLSLSFITEAKYGINFFGSAGGLLLLEIPSYCSSISPFLCLCNPLTKSWTQVPSTSSITTISAKGITESENGGHIVVALGKTKENLYVLEVYDSLLKSWRIAGRLPDGMLVKSQEIVFCEGFLFCVTAEPLGVMAYDIQYGSFTMLAIPLHKDGMRPRLVACASRVFMVETIEKEHVVRDIMIVEVQMDSRSTSWWKEIGKMPQGILVDFLRTSCSKWFECVGVEDCLCFRAHGSVEVIAYNVKKSTWCWLPKCDNRYGSHNMFMKSSCYWPCFQ